MMLNSGRLLNERIKTHPRKIAVVAKSEQLDFLTLNQRANRLAHVLAGQGVKCNDKVGILLPNSPEFVVAYLAVQKAGGVTVPLDMKLPPKDVDAILRFADARLLVTLPSAESIADIKQPMVTVEKEQIKCKGEILHPPDDDWGVDRSAGDEATYLYTSGSTGQPKLAVLTHENLSCFPRVVQEIYATSSEEVYGLLLPMSHVSGPIAIQELIEHGTTLVFLDLMTERRGALQSIQENKVTLIWGVVPLYRLLIHEAKIRKFDTSRLRILAVMGMETPVDFMREMSQAFPHTAVVQGYGLTETSGVVIGTPPRDAVRKMQSIGRPVHFMDVRIVDAKGNPLPPKRHGEIVVKGAAVMKGYYRNEAATKERIKDGWLHTGDVGCLDEEGYLYLLGRTDDMIITGGLNVFPGEVEDVIRRHPKVKDVAVVGLPDPGRGTIVKAVIVPSSEITKEEILKFCRLNLSPFKCPRMVEFRDDLPKTSTGKISRGALRRMEKS
jgi:long-chain acyl-CoA synthetase